MQHEGYVLKKILFPKFLFAALFFSALFSSCNYGLPLFLFWETGVEDRAQIPIELPGSQLPQIGKNARYSFIVLTDSHFGKDGTARADAFFLKKFEELLQSQDEGARPRFIVNIGDTLDGGHEIEALYFNIAAQAWIDAGKKALGASDYKVYSILGNHDLYNDGWEVWSKTIYPYNSYYKFTLNASGGQNSGFDFLFLDTGNGTLGGSQIESLERALAASSRPKIVFMHYPVYAGGLVYFALDDVQERARLIADFAASNVKYVFEGHTHSPRDYDFGSFKEAVVGSYLEERVFGLVTVDESAGSVQFTRMRY